jgi:mRNA interferase YafQ
MKRLRVQGRFEKDLALLDRRGIDLVPVAEIIAKLRRGIALPANSRPHPLRGEWVGFKELHLGGDLIMIYRLTKEELQLVRIGNHSDLFKE